MGARTCDYDDDAALNGVFGREQQRAAEESRDKFGYDSRHQYQPRKTPVYEDIEFRLRKILLMRRGTKIKKELLQEAADVIHRLRADLIERIQKEAA